MHIYLRGLLHHGWLECVVAALVRHHSDAVDGSLPHFGHGVGRVLQQRGEHALQKQKISKYKGGQQ